ncbi:MAG TPA: response regulator [Tepidisphaeraceae bacterium]|nr:response regulator [Tepidisphaeraceae bacterium]
MKILLVDDSKMMRTIQKQILAGLGAAEFVEAADGVEALKQIAAVGAFQLILIDWNMPNMDGITLVNRIRETDKSTPLMMITTEAEKSKIMEAIKAGVNNYALKPFTPDSLMEKVKQTLAKAA